MEKYAVLLHAKDSKIETCTLDPEKSMLQNCYDLIGCDMIDVPPMLYLPEPFVCVVDDNGRLGKEVYVNRPASIAYGMADHGQPIVGNALILKSVDTDDGMELEGLTMQEAQKATKHLLIALVDDVLAAINRNRS